MIYLNPNNPNIIKAKLEHYNCLIDELYKRIDKYVLDSNSIILFDFFIIPFIDEILTGLPNIIIESNNKIENLVQRNLIFKKNIENVFKYSDWFDQKKEKYCSYHLAENIGVQTCVYCNRIYTKTVIKPSKITRPEFDHWFPKNEFPLLALSFYNLIPSCHICNSSVKGRGKMELKTHFHPYIDNEKTINDEIKFSYYNKTLNKYGFNIKTKSKKAENTVAFFKLKEIYETHEDELADLKKIANIYSGRYLELLSKQYKGLSISQDEIYRLAFGTELDTTKFSNRPLSKLKKDILTELGIIK